MDQPRSLVEEMPDLVALGNPFIARFGLDGDGGTGEIRSEVRGGFNTSVASSLLTTAAW